MSTQTRAEQCFAAEGVLSRTTNFRTIETENHFLRIGQRNRNGIHFIFIDLLEFYVISRIHYYQAKSTNIKWIPFRFYGCFLFKTNQVNQELGLRSSIQY